VIDETRLRACEKEIQELKIHMSLLLNVLKFEKELPVLGPGRFENFVNSLRQALAEPNL
jgi:DNA-binding SARP family transcriptional activator